MTNPRATAPTTRPENTTFFASLVCFVDPELPQKPFLLFWGDRALCSAWIRHCSCVSVDEKIPSFPSPAEPFRGPAKMKIRSFSHLKIQLITTSIL